MTLSNDPLVLKGFKTPSDAKFPVTVRDWNALKLATWRAKHLSEVAARQAEEILDRCNHSDGCQGGEAEENPCDPDCPDRETRMSALVILNAARQLAPENARRPADDKYFAPSREYYSEIVAALSAAQVEIKILQTALRDAGLQVPTPGAGIDSAPLMPKEIR